MNRQSLGRLGPVARLCLALAVLCAFVSACHKTVALSPYSPQLDWNFHVVFLPAFTFSGGPGQPYWIAPGDGFRVAWTELSFSEPCQDGSQQRVDLCNLPPPSGCPQPDGPAQHPSLGLFECANGACGSGHEAQFNIAASDPTLWTQIFQLPCRAPGAPVMDDPRFPIFQPWEDPISQDSTFTYEVAATYNPAFSAGRPALENGEILAPEQLVVHYFAPPVNMTSVALPERLMMVPTTNGSSGDRRFTLPSGFQWDLQFSTSLRISKVRVYTGAADTNPIPFCYFTYAEAPLNVRCDTGTEPGRLDAPVGSGCGIDATPAAIRTMVSAGQPSWIVAFSPTDATCPVPGVNNVYLEFTLSQ